MTDNQGMTTKERTELLMSALSGLSTQVLSMSPLILGLGVAFGAAAYDHRVSNTLAAVTAVLIGAAVASSALSLTIIVRRLPLNNDSEVVREMERNLLWKARLVRFSAYAVLSATIALVACVICRSP